MRKQKVPELIEFIHANTETRRDFIKGKLVKETVIGVGPHIGCVLARRIRSRDETGRFASRIAVGWSQVNRNAGDTFDKNEAVRIARERAIHGNAPSLTRKMQKPFDRMLERADRYFKDRFWA